MGLLDKNTLAKAKSLLDKNADKIAKGVDKATNAVDKATKGKSAKLTSKVDQAAKKLVDKSAAESGATGSDPTTTAAGDPTAGPTTNDA